MSARYTDLYDFAPVGHVTLDRDGQITQANLAAASLLGPERARLTGKRFAPFVAEADRPGFNECLRQVWAGEVPQTCAVELETIDPPRTVQIVAALSTDELECRLVVEDITERKAAEAALQESHVRLNEAQALAKIGSWSYCLSDQSIEWSDQMFDLFPQSREDGPPSYKSLYSSIHPQDRAHWKNAVDACSKSGEKYKTHFRSRFPDKIIWIEAIGQAIRDKDSQIVRQYGTCQNITERKQAQEALRRSTLLLEASQSIAQTGGWELDLGTNQLFWTAETYRILDTSPEEFNPTVEAVVGYFLPESRRIISAALQAAMGRGEGYDLVLETLTTKGRRIDVRTTCAVTLHEGRPVRLTGIFQGHHQATGAGSAIAAGAENGGHRHPCRRHRARFHFIANPGKRIRFHPVKCTSGGGEVESAQVR